MADKGGQIKSTSVEANNTKAGASTKKISKKANRKKSTKKTSKKKSSNSTAASSAARTSHNQRRPYPTRTLEQALKIGQAIKDQNNGNPWDTELVARAALDVKPTANKFFYLAAASRDYGLTIGGRDSEKVELTDLGKRVFFAGSEDERSEALVEAFFNVDVFDKVYKYYSGSANLPENPEFLSNTLLAEFNLATEYHDEFVEIFRNNCTFLQIESGTGRRAVRQKDANIEAAEAAGVRVVGEPKGKFDRTAFVIMPFSEKGTTSRPQGFFKEVLEGLITPAANAAGFAVETANQHGSDVIQSTIIGKLLAADLVIADLTDHNPNVLFELGVRLTKELPVALIKSDDTGSIFDVDNMLRVVKYHPNLWASTVKTDIPKLSDHIKASWDNSATAPNYMQILTGSSRA